MAEVKLRLDADAYYPGDIIKLSAEQRRTDYGEFSIQFLSHPKLHFVGCTPEPVRYQGGVYVQRAVWRFQAVAAGEFLLRGIEDGLDDGDGLPPLTVTVHSYGELRLSDDLAVLPADTVESTEVSGYVALVCLMTAAIVIVACYFSRSTRTEGARNEVPSVELDDLVERLEQGQPVSEIIEQLLARSDLQLCAELREAMEAAAYGGRTDDERLLQLIRRGGEA